MQTHKTNTGVVIPTFNRASTILDALNSVVSQTVLPKRLVIVDDGSTDNTLSTVKNWINQQQKLSVELVSLPNGGVSRARNEGIDRLKDCDYIATLDSDDQWPADFIERTTTALECDPQAALAAVPRQFDERDSPLLYTTEQLIKKPIKSLLCDSGGIISCSMIRRSILVDRVGLFDESLLSGQDTDLFVRLAAVNPNWIYLPGLPVKISYYNCNRRPTNIRSSLYDVERRWAYIHERLFCSQKPHLSRQDTRAVSWAVAFRWMGLARHTQHKIWLNHVKLPFSRSRFILWYLKICLKSLRTNVFGFLYVIKANLKADFQQQIQLLKTKLGSGTAPAGEHRP